MYMIEPLPPLVRYRKRKYQDKGGPNARLNGTRRWVGVLLCMMMLAIALPAQADSPSIGLILDGQKLTMEVPPVIVGGRTLVPLRAIMEALGARVEWNQETKTATVLHEGHVVALPEGSRTALVDGAEITLDVPAQTVSGRMLVPVRFLVEATGGEVDWLPNDNTVVMAVRDETLKARLRVDKDNRDLPNAPPDLWKAAAQMGFQLKVPTRERSAVDGVVHLEGQAAARLNGSSIVLNVMGPPQTGTHETTLPIQGGAFAGDIYLADGPGWYTIQVFAPENPGDETVTMVTSLSVKNVGTRHRQSPYYTRGYAKSGLTLDLPASGQIAVDTTFALRGTADPKLNGRFVWLKAEKGDGEWSSYLQIRDGKLVGDAHLGGGPGLHWVTVNLQAEPGANLYSPVAHIPVMNTSARVARQPLVVMPYGQEALLKMEPLPDSVPDGFLNVSGEVDPQRKMASVLVKVTHDGKDDNVFLPVADGRFQGRVPLSLGAGEYEISFMVQRTTAQYQEGATARVTNQAVQVVRGFRYTAQAIEQMLQLTAPAADPFSAGAKLTLAGSVGVPQKDYPYVLAVTQYKDLEATYRLPITNGQFSGDAELRFGPGTYEVVLYTQTAPTQIAELVRFTVTTSAAKDERDRLPSASIESENPQIVALAKELTADKSAMDAGKAVFEWTAKNVQYDRHKAASWRVDPDEGAKRTLQTRIGVCRDYAALAVALLRAAGIKSHVVTGKAGSGYAVAGHAWVEFYNGDRWVEMDPTFASGVVSGTEFIPRYDARYFDPAPDFLKTTHTRDGIQY